MISRLVLRVLLALFVVASIGCKKQNAAPKVLPPTAEEAEAFAKRFATIVSSCDGPAIEAAFDYKTLVARMVAGTSFSKPQLEQFRREMREAMGTGFCQQLAESNYTYLRTQMIDGAPRPLLRVVDASGALNYHQLLLDKQGSEVRLVDIYFYASGEHVSETFRKLADTLLESGSMKTSLMLQRIKELMASGDSAEARRVLQQLPAAVRKTKAAMLLEVGLTSEDVDAPEYLAAIEAYGKAFPNDPSLDLVMLDSMFLRKQFDEALVVIDRLDERVGGDAYLDAMRAGIYGEAGKREEAVAAAKRATEREPTLESAWWQLLTQQSAAQQYAGAVATLATLRDKFGAPTDRESLAADERFTGLAASKEYSDWAGAESAPE